MRRRKSRSTNRSSQVDCSNPGTAGLAVLKIGSDDQPVLAKKGDDLRIDWGALLSGRADGCGNLVAHAAGDGVAQGRLCQRAASFR